MPTKAETNVHAFESALKIALHAGEPVFVADDVYELANLIPTAGAWYLAVECPQCKRTTPILRDPSDGTRKPAFVGLGKMRVPCLFCSREITTAIRQPLVIQWP
jgi:hypothetical protein